PSRADTTSHLPPFPTRRSSDLYCYVEFTGNNPDTGAATIVLIFLRPVMAIIPLLPLALPVLWLVLNVYGLIKLDSIYENLSTGRDRKSTRLNSSHVSISYAVFC